MSSNFLDFHKFYSDRSTAPAKPATVSTGTKIIKKTFSREYRTLTCLGKGGFGQAFDGRRRSDNAPVVIKFLPRDRILNWGTFDGVCRLLFYCFKLIRKTFSHRNVYHMK